jgi:hypothetical protein
MGEWDSHWFTLPAERWSFGYESTTFRAVYPVILPQSGWLASTQIRPF